MKRLTILLFSIVLLLHANAQQLTLSNAINIALENSFGIQLAKNNVEANTVLNNYGVAGGLPAVTGTTTDNEQITSLKQKLSNGTNTNRNGVAANNLSASVNASILLYNGMRVVTTKQRLEQLQQQSEAYLNAEIQNTIAAVMTQYYDVVRQQGYLATLDTSIAAAQQRLDIVKARQQVGLANNADLFQSQLDLNALLQNRVAQVAVIKQSQADFLTALNLSPDSVVTIHDTIVPATSVQLEDVLSKLDNNPEVQALVYQVSIDSLIARETAAQRYPSLRFNTGVGYNRSTSAAGFNLLNQTYGPTFGLSLSIPIYNGSVIKRQQQVAEINTKNATLQKDQLLQSNTASAVKTFEAYNSAVTQLETQRQNYQLAKQLLDLVLQKFQLRNATIVDVKNAQQTFEDAGYLLVNLSFAAKAAEIELKRISNTLTY